MAHSRHGQSVDSEPQARWLVVLAQENIRAGDAVVVTARGVWRQETFQGSRDGCIHTVALDDIRSGEFGRVAR